MAKWIFVMFYVFFLSVFLFMGSLPNSPVQNIIISAIGFEPTPPTCNFTGTFLDIFAIVICGVEQLGYFISLVGISIAEGYGWLWTLLFAPLVITFIWIFIEFLRGNE
ncbi:MAG: hypothetical protein AM326_08255 [Candidatus Thorarchaeota archaeon SMTZ-45]|nr:MAG: hypothetical protein AM326_08255 [Candidatus Thorarchaeota archaeon SMTZ-45]